MKHNGKEYTDNNWDVVDELEFPVPNKDLASNKLSISEKRILMSINTAAIHFKASTRSLDPAINYRVILNEWLDIPGWVRILLLPIPPVMRKFSYSARLEIEQNPLILSALTKAGYDVKCLNPDTLLEYVEK